MNRMRFVRLAVLGVLGLSPAVSAVTAAAAPPPEVVRLMDAHMKEQKAPGISVAAVGPAGLLWSGGFGWADVEAKRPATASTRYQFASVTKVYTALLLAQMAAEGTVDLDAPLSRLLPELQPAYRETSARPVTLRDVATHSAGFTRDMIGPKASGRSHAYTLAELLAWQRQSGLWAPPGTQYKYSNFGYAVLGAALERAAGKPYRDLLRERVIDPLGLSATGFAEQRTQPEMATSYGVDGDHVKANREPVWDFGAQASASEVIATVDDVARFARAHLGPGHEGVVTAKVKDLLFTPAFPLEGGGAIGLGWRLSSAQGIPYWSHGGHVNNFESLLVVRPDVGLGLVLAANGPGALGNLVAPLLMLIAPQADTASIDRVVGDYTDGRGAVAKVRRTPDAVLTIEVRGAVRMTPWGRHTYRISEGHNAGDWVHFATEDGRPVMVWESRKWARR